MEENACRKRGDMEWKHGRRELVEKPRSEAHANMHLYALWSSPFQQVRSPPLQRKSNCE